MLKNCALPKFLGLMSLAMSMTLISCDSDDVNPSASKDSQEEDASSSSVKKSSTSKAKSSSSVAKSSSSKKTSSASTAKSSDSGKQKASSSSAKDKSGNSSSATAKSATSSSASTAKSSASVKSSSSVAKPASSNTAASSSAKAVSSSAAVSSSSVAMSSANQVFEGIGTCIPAKAVAEIGEDVTWKFVRNNVVAAAKLLTATFSWTFEGGSPSYAVVTNAAGVSQTAKYAKSGDYGASLKLVIDGVSYAIPCSPVHINGAPITGCKCSTENATVDFTATPDVAWTVTGCSTGEGLSLAYEWDGSSGTSTFTQTFAAASDGYAPKLKVSNSDNSVVDVECPAVKVTEGPEFVIDEPQGTGAIKLPAGTSIVHLNVAAFANSVFCQVNRNDVPTGVLNGTVGVVGSLNRSALKGNDYISTRVDGNLVSGTVLEFTLDSPATCGVY